MASRLFNAFTDALDYFAKHGGFRDDSSGNLAGNVVVRDIGVISQSRNRIRTGLAETYATATNTVTWNAADNIREVTCLVTATDSAAAPPPSTEGYVLVAVDAPSTAVAAAWLTEVDSASDDAQVYKFLVGERLTLRTSNAVERLDFLPVDVSATLSNIHLWVGAN